MRVSEFLEVFMLGYLSSVPIIEGLLFLKRVKIKFWL